jgi:group I intron endonuclease
MSSGIYRIRNTVTQESYVGSAADIGRRVHNHRRYLQSGCHQSLLLSQAWAQYGADSFAFETLEIVADVNHLTEREQFWIDHLKAHRLGYNATHTARRRPISDGPRPRRHQLRLPDDITARIDAVRPKGITAPSRHDWFLDAVIEKLEREEAR